ncbi:hypothetical protein VUR80DRAFT_7502 [Thermomyces stellatus]
MTRSLPNSSFPPHFSSFPRSSQNRSVVLHPDPVCSFPPRNQHAPHPSPPQFFPQGPSAREEKASTAPVLDGGKEKEEKFSLPASWNSLSITIRKRMRDSDSDVNDKRKLPKGAWYMCVVLTAVSAFRSCLSGRRTEKKKRKQARVKGAWPIAHNGGMHVPVDRILQQ